MPLASIDWTTVIVSGIGAAVSLGGVAISAWVALQIRTPSGDSIGAVADRTHDITHVTAAVAQTTLGKVVQQGRDIQSARDDIASITMDSDMPQ